MKTGLFVIAAIAACSCGRAELPAGTHIYSDIAYGSDPAQRLDVYRPRGARNAPVIFMVHGGGWRRGDKAYPGVVDNKAAHWLAQGYVFISTNYRLLPDADPLEQANDVARALSYAQYNARSWGADGRRFVVMGHSAGAHLVSLITAAPEIARQNGARPWLATIPLDSAAFNVVEIMTHPHPSLYDDAFGTDEDFWTAASPILRLKSATIPMLLVYSSQRDGSSAQAQAFAAKDKELGARVVLLPEDLSHGEINDNLGLPGAYTSAVDAFLKSLGLPNHRLRRWFQPTTAPAHPAAAR